MTTYVFANFCSYDQLCNTDLYSIIIEEIVMRWFNGWAFEIHSEKIAERNTKQNTCSRFIF